MEEALDLSSDRILNERELCVKLAICWNYTKMHGHQITKLNSCCLTQINKNSLTFFRMFQGSTVD